jgi:hypothetical protein
VCVCVCVCVCAFREATFPVKEVSHVCKSVTVFQNLTILKNDYEQFVGRQGRFEQNFYARTEQLGGPVAQYQRPTAVGVQALVHCKEVQCNRTVLEIAVHTKLKKAWKISGSENSTERHARLIYCNACYIARLVWDTYIRSLILLKADGGRCPAAFLCVLCKDCMQLQLLFQLESSHINLYRGRCVHEKKE